MYSSLDSCLFMHVNFCHCDMKILYWLCGLFETWWYGIRCCLMLAVCEMHWFTMKIVHQTRGVISDKTPPPAWTHLSHGDEWWCLAGRFPTDHWCSPSQLARRSPLAVIAQDWWRWPHSDHHKMFACFIAVTSCLIGSFWRSNVPHSMTSNFIVA